MNTRIKEHTRSAGVAHALILATYTHHTIGYASNREIEAKLVDAEITVLMAYLGLGGLRVLIMMTLKMRKLPKKGLLRLKVTLSVSPIFLWALSWLMLIKRSALKTQFI